MLSRNVYDTRIFMDNPTYIRYDFVHIESNVNTLILTYVTPSIHDVYSLGH